MKFRLLLAKLLRVIPRDLSIHQAEFARLAGLAAGPATRFQVYEYVRGRGGEFARAVSRRAVVARALQIATYWSAECKVTRAASALMSFRVNHKWRQADPNVHERVEEQLWCELEAAVREAHELMGGSVGASRT